MGLIRVLIIFLIIAFISGIIRAFMAKRNITGGFRRKKSSDFISEELYKLHELRKRGILTEEEYQREKSKLLNR